MNVSMVCSVLSTDIGSQVRNAEASALSTACRASGSMIRAARVTMVRTRG